MGSVIMILKLRKPALKLRTAIDPIFAEEKLNINITSRNRKISHLLVAEKDIKSVRRYNNYYYS